MSKKILFCATVDYHFKAFHLPYMKWLKEQGWDVHVVSAGTIDLPFTDVKFNIPIQRSPFNRSNIKAYRELKKIIDKYEYSIIHCHTPLGGVLTRLAAKQARQRGTKVIYTAHGFHFCKGAPLMNWLIYYPIEKYLSSYTDSLITINTEDYHLATNQKFKAGRIEHVHGVGVDTERFKPVNQKTRNEWRKTLGYQPDDFLLFYAAEFNKNKNQQLLIKALAMIKDELPKARLLLAGTGPQLAYCKELAKSLDVIQSIDFLGFRNDIEELLPICDIAVASSFREGLPVNIMEAMSCGLPVVASENRGHKELITNHKNGWLIDSEDIKGLSEKIILLENDKKLSKTLGMNGRDLIKTKYSMKHILNEKSRIYKRYMDETEAYEWAIQ